MRKPKATVKSLREELKNLQAQFDVYKEKTRAFVLAIKTEPRPLMTIEPANNKGMINGLTIPEQVMLVNLNNNTGETTFLQTTNNGKDLFVVAKKNVSTPWGLL
jgi:hypothetical protein